MLCAVFGHSYLDILTIILYTCVWVPMAQMKDEAIDAIRAVYGAIVPIGTARGVGPDEMVGVDGIPAAKFRELECLDVVADGPCSICLGEFDGEELVSQLPGCRHVFHALCIGRWLDRDGFTCPLCRVAIF